MASRLGKNEKRWRHRIHFLSQSVHSKDEVCIRYFDTQENLPALVFANGLGGPTCAWRPYLDRWRGKFRIITWDYRGLYGSRLPPHKVDLSVRSHAEDLSLVLQDAGVKNATFVGWSMGVQVGLEFYSQNQRTLSHLVFISGTFGRPLQGVPLPFSGYTLPRLVRGIRLFHSPANRAMHRATRSRWSFPVLRRLGLIAPGLSHEHFQEMVREFRSIDFAAYLDLLTHLGNHDAEDTLPDVDIPTLVVAGSKDIITPPWLSRRIARVIPKSELFMIPGATHYSAAEYPELISKRIERFLEHHATD